MKTTEIRFWSRVRKSDECWVWTGATKPCKNSIRGRFSFRGKMHYAHRVSWILHYGEIPKGLCVCHKCDNPPCVRPDHLFIGTNKDNMNDRDNKRRQPHGEKHASAILSEKDVIFIRKNRKQLPSSTKLGIRYGVSSSAIRQLLLGWSWKHLL